MAKQLTFDEFLGDGRAVHFDEGGVLARTLHMDEARHLLLAAAVLAREQHPALRGRHQGHISHEPLHGRAVRQEEAPPLHLGEEALVFLFQLRLAQGIAHHQEEPVEVDGLLEKVEGPEFGGLHGGVDAGMAGDHHHGQLGSDLLGLLQSLEAVLPREPDIQQHEL